ncbi:cyclic beta 1-2 glucan synthetase [Desulfofustis limnaeus]|uniref:Cyclic beta 1-2 glucan synthetase n=2 Tax=Desulfofustis limnaeus TaxID=2740163 RepID=A0ABN6M4N6_9BACT|nr:cyclic beta 1-2 glucan synthetase [Desulfofustis limnaeus]
MWNLAVSLVLVLGCAVIGTAVALVWLRRSRHGIELGVIDEHSRRLMPGESAIILQTSVDSLQCPMALLRESGEAHPALFVIHPRRERRVRERVRAAKLSPTQIQEHALRHAGEQVVDSRPNRSAELLKRLGKSRTWIRKVCADLSIAIHLEQKTTPATDWILDNEYILEDNTRDVLVNLPRIFYLRLPVLASANHRGLPCIYGLAKDLVSHTDLRLDRENVLTFIEAYQSVRTLSIGELWAVPQMLRIALIENIQSFAITALEDLRERQLADLWANRVLAANHHGANQLFMILAELATAVPHPSPYFATQLVGLLDDEDAALALVRSWLKRTFKEPLYDLSQQEQNRQAREQLSCGNAFTSLRQLALLDWREVFEEISRVDQILRRDPSGIYAGTDFATRDRCRRAIEEIALAAVCAEEQVAEEAIEQASRVDGRTANDERRSHVGTWLVGEGRAELTQLLACREARRYRLLTWIYRHHTTFYLSAVGTVFLMLAVPIAIAALNPGGPAAGSPILHAGLVLLLLIPVSQLAIELVNYLISRLLPPRTLPKMDFREQGIPDAFRTLVVVPMMLVDDVTIRSEVEKLEIRFLANKEANLFFSLFADYTDSPTPTREDDGHLLQTASTLITELNRRHGGERFFLFHRSRVWCQSEQQFIGWERKRGKLEELNRLIDGTRPESAASLVLVGDPQRLVDVRFVITLDSDTQLPHGTARRLVETLAHPLNQPRLDASGRIIAGSYTIIQPRVSPNLESTNRSVFSRLFADAIGVDPYTEAVSDVYQDLSGEGSYQGKGIYDVHAFSRLLSERLPDERVLSHDLLEGAHVRVGLASDIELFDDFPQDYLGYSSRAHRWIRGDWQIAAWLLPLVPQPAGGRGRNQLSLINRWKILDNLRRSLLPAASLSLLLLTWFISPRAGMIAGLVVGLQLFFHPLAQPLTMATSRGGLKCFDPFKIRHDLLRATANAALLPHQAAVALDAIFRACYRCLISRRDLLQWKTQACNRNSSRRGPLFVAGLTLVALLSGMVGLAIWQVILASLPQAVPWLFLWLVAPLIGWLLNLPPGTERQVKPLPEKDRLLLRQIARRTWRYFSSFVNVESHWLPPDNYQVSHQSRLALRTSPTNIGLWLTSALGAGDSGYLTVNQVVGKLTATMDSISRLDRYRGHLLNWYDIRTLAPLEPRYVSTVDSGNLLGSLLVLEQGLGELLHLPLLSDKAFTSLADTAEIMKHDLIRQGSGGAVLPSLEALLREWHSPPTAVADQLGLQRRMARELSAIVTAADSTPWTAELAEQASAWQVVSECYLTWIEILAEKSAEELVPLGEAGLAAIGQALARAPSLIDLAHDRINAMAILRRIREKVLPAESPLLPWLDRVLAAYANAQWLAGETLAMGEQLIARVRELSDGMDMGFLYDSKRKLFTISYNVSMNRSDDSNYDLLASEARLGSFLAIARGDVPLEHWFSLSRPYGAVGRRRVLLSWTGTMFEYLMPLLFQRSYDNSLLDKAVREAVAVQIAYGRSHSVPWGISESAFADLDREKTYQYKAFGVPILGLKRGLEEKLVVAPYATLLALQVAPAEAVENLKRLASLGMLAEYGYFEAMDFSRQAERDPITRRLKRGVIVETYMAHHQGMAFLALTNFLHGNPFPRRFHSEPLVRAFEALLQERIPVLPPLHLISIRHNEPVLLGGELIGPTASTFTSPHTIMPTTLLLSNGRYDLMISNSGGGYSSWKGMEISRWRSDQTRDASGIFCYLHEKESDRLWSAAYHPVGGTPEGYSVDFTLDRAIFRRTDHGITTETEICISPEDDVEVRRITLMNHSSRIRQVSLTSYVELSMAAHNADRQHPAFNKLFIQTEAIVEDQVLLAYRRSRSVDEPPLYVAHRLTCKPVGSGYAAKGGWQFETDRVRFIGRGRNLARPMGALQNLGNSQGFVLDPILSLRQNIILEPGQGFQVCMVLAAGASRGEVLLLMDKYSELHAAERTMDFAWHSAQQQLQMLHIQPDEARRFQLLASHLLYPYGLLRASAARLEDNHKGQAGLWPYGISGDRPIILVTIGEPRESALVRQLLQARTFWQMHGLSVDLVILNEEEAGYDQPVQERLEQLIQVHSLTAAYDRGGAVFLKSANQIPEDDLKLLRAAANVVLVAARGTLPQQLKIPVEPPVPLVKLERKRAPVDPSAPLPFMDLEYFNSLGGFTPDGREYAIYFGPDTNTPAPWVNVMANPNFGTMVSETGAGFTWYGNSQRNRLTGWSNDPVLDSTSEALYIRDEESGVFWSPTMAPIREPLAYRARHGAGYSVFEHNSHGIEQELTIFVPVDDNGGQPVKLQRLRLTNASRRRRRISVTYYVELTLGENRETSGMHIITRRDEETRALFAQNRYHPDYGERVTFVAITPPPESYSGDRTSFIGRNRSLAQPFAMELSRLVERVGAGLDPCAVLRVIVDLAPGEHRDVTCLLGQAESSIRARELVLGFQDGHHLEDALVRTTAWWDDLLGTVEVHTPERSADLLINRWLRYQSLSSRLWGRSGFYQSSGAYGFRDQLQDVLAFCATRPQLAREQILLAASRQFREGDVQHWWHPPGGAGIRSRISDDLLWLPYVTAHYVRTTGDAAILETEIPFLEAAVLADDQHELYAMPAVSFEQATLFEHCRRAVARGQTAGSHGLPLIGTGDWNDGLSLVGAEGRGESVWLAWFLCDVLQGMSELAESLQQPELSKGYRQDRKILAERIEQFGWDGQWYLRGTFDDGSPLGSAVNSEARIDSLPQSWAWLTGAAEPARAVQALGSAWHHLVCEAESLVLLFTPPFDTSEPSPGYIMGYPPGVRENGGQYTHAALWLAMAMARSGNGGRAVQLLRMLNPIEHARDAEAAWRYGVEPYVVAADVYRLPGRSGQGGWSWYTGSAAWMYRAWVEEVLGVQVHAGQMRIDPVIPAGWPGFSLRYRHGEAAYEIKVENPEACEHGVAWVELDNLRLTGNVVPLERSLVTHQVLVRMGSVAA